MNETVEHLKMIQGVINRMTQVSFLLKGWAVTLVVTLLAVAINTQNSWLGFIALVPTVVFGCLDAYYLRQERLFRDLYDKVRLGPSGSGILVCVKKIKNLGVIYCGLRLFVGFT
jgi:hypothetical protein